jgi:hypothetical protein
MEIKGTLKNITLPTEKEVKGKNYITCNAIITQEGQYPKDVAIELNKVELIEKFASRKLNTEVSVEINIESREYNGKWYTNIKAWRLND